jgi:hypothetical protein
MQVPDQGRDSETVHSLCFAIGYPYPVLLGAPVSSGPKFQSLLREMLGDQIRTGATAHRVQIVTAAQFPNRPGLKFSPDWGLLWRSQEPCRFWHRRRLP